MKCRKMFRLLTVINICLINCIGTKAQEDADYFLANTESGQYLVYGIRFLINFPDDACYEFIENISLTKGNKFIIMYIMDEMDNGRGVIIFDKKGNQINYDKVQKQRKKYYQPYNCCIVCRGT